MSDRPSANAVQDTAMLWAVRADDGLSPEEQAELDGWLAGGVRELGAFARAEAILSQARRATALGNGAPFETPPAMSDDAAGHRGISRRTALAAGVVIAAAGAGLMALPAAATVYRTRKGELLRVPLPRGASMTLNTDTEVMLTEDADRPEIALVHGEVLVEAVGRFACTAPMVRIAAESAGFTLSARQGQTDLVVQRGSLTVWHDDQRQPVRVGSETQLRFRKGGAPQAIRLSAAEIGRASLWREGLVAFEETTLADAAATYRLYSDYRIEIAPAVGRETVTGVFSVNDPRGFAQAAAETLSLTAEPHSDHVKIF